MTHQIDDLVDMIHERDVRLSVRPDQETGGGGGVVALVHLGGGVHQGGQGDDRADGPDGDERQTEENVCSQHRLGTGDGAVSEVVNIFSPSIDKLCSELISISAQSEKELVTACQVNYDYF